MKRLMTMLLFVMNFIVVQAQSIEQDTVIHQGSQIVQTILSNGLTVLVRSIKDAATVSIQLWYNVGAKDEVDGEHGMAHFIEHMIFKGTEKLTETDIDLVTTKLSGDCNAFTWSDWTGYVFNIPVANWDKVLPIMADCMENCTFKQDHLNSELKAVIQELKMCKDQFARNLREVMITNIFESHPYHYSTIGFKQDLWNLRRETLLAFYKKYYTPDNAVMVVVGDVDPKDVHEKMEKEFGHIPAGNGWNRKSFYVNEDIKSKSIRLYRDIKQPICHIAYVLPGFVEQKQFEFEVFGVVLAGGKSSRLHKLLVDDLQLVVDVQPIVFHLQDRTIFFIAFNPKEEKDIDLIVRHIQSQIDDIAQNGATEKEVERARRFVKLEHEQSLENTFKQAFEIGQYFVHMHSIDGFLNYGNVSCQQIMQTIQDTAATYCTAVVRHQGDVLAIPQAHVEALNKLQQASDEEDTLFLNAKQRESVVEGGSYVHSVTINEKKVSNFSKPGSLTLSNGMELLWLHNDTVDTVELLLNMKADHRYDNDAQQGIGMVVSSMLLEGTKNYPGQQFADEVESYGISLNAIPGSIGMTLLKEDLNKGLTLLTEMLVRADFTEKSFAKVKEQSELQLKTFWDTPTSFNWQLARELVYKNHPHAKLATGSQETIATITLQDCVDYYKKMVTPKGARLAIVGNLADVNVQELVEKTVGAWQGEMVEDLNYPSLTTLEKQTVVSPINRDQIVLNFVGLSVERFHEDFDKILLFDQILCGSTVHSMSTRLFKLRQRSGLFYTCGGSLVAGANEQPGMIFIRTIVSPDRAAEAEAAILQVIDEAINDLQEEELSEAKRMLINSFDKLYDSNAKKAGTFLFLNKYNLPADYFSQRTELLQKITIEEIQTAVRKILSSEKLAVIKIGRVSE